MKDILIFTLANCPHCINAKKYLEQLLSNNDEYKKLNIRVIDEVKEKEFADTFDYYYVPTFYVDNKKLFEGIVTADNVKKVLDTAINS